MATWAALWEAAHVFLGFALVIAYVRTPKVICEPDIYHDG
jgi:hypothetical protein